MIPCSWPPSRSADGKPGVGLVLRAGALGKTLMAPLTRVLRSCNRREANATAMIIVCPNSFKAGWVDEDGKAYGFKFDVHVWRSSQKAKAADFLNCERHAAPRRARHQLREAARSHCRER